MIQSEVATSRLSRGGTLTTVDLRPCTRVKKIIPPSKACACCERCCGILSFTSLRSGGCSRTLLLHRVLLASSHRRLAPRSRCVPPATRNHRPNPIPDQRSPLARYFYAGWSCRRRLGVMRQSARLQNDGSIRALTLTPAHGKIRAWTGLPKEALASRYAEMPSATSSSVPSVPSSTVSPRRCVYCT